METKNSEYSKKPFFRIHALPLSINKPYKQLLNNNEAQMQTNNQKAYQDMILKHIKENT